MRNILINTVAVILATGLVMAGLLALVQYPDADSDRTISVQGEATRTVAADEAELRFAVITEDEESSVASQENAARMEAIIAALQEYGEVETEGYSLQPVYDYGYFPSETQRDLKIQFYRASNTVVLKTTDLGVIGDAIDAAAQAGANRVDGLSFQLSDDARKQLREELLAEAAASARGKAEGIAEGLDVRIGRVSSVSEGSVYFPYARGAAYDMAESAMAKTPVEPGTLDVQASVSVTYSIR